METFMARPTDVLKVYMRSRNLPRSFEYGQLAMGLEVVSLIRTLESIPVVNDAEREGTIATLYTLLRECDLEDVFDLYERLSTWRRVKIQPLDNTPRGVSSWRARERPTISYADAPASQHLQALTAGSVSPHAAPRQSLAPSDRLRALTLVRPSPGQDAYAIDGQLELFPGGS